MRDQPQSSRSGFFASPCSSYWYVHGLIVQMENCHGGKWAQLAVVHLSRKRCFALSRRRVVLTLAFISYVFSSYHALDFAETFRRFFLCDLTIPSSSSCILFGRVVMDEFSPALLEHFHNHFRDFQWIPCDDNRHACIPLTLMDWLLTCHRNIFVAPTEESSKL